MSEAAHTPGIWCVEKFDPDAEFTFIGGPIAIVGGEELCEKVRFTVGTLQDWGPHGIEQTEANARLIAAAPDLLAALKAICKDATECECHGEPSTVDGIQWDDIIAARAAIAKAGGAA